MALLSTHVTLARETLEDYEAVAYRVSDARFIDYANDFVREACLLRPEFFATIGDIACTAGTCAQSAPAGSIVLIDVFQVKNGRVVTEVKREIVDRYNPNWWNDTAGVAENWIRDVTDRIKFFIYPKAPSSQTVVAKWAVLPTAMTAIGDTLPAQIPDAYLPALHHYMVFRALARPNDAAKMAAAAPFYTAFANLFGVGQKTRESAEAEEPNA